MVDAAVLGHRIRHFRSAAGLTLDALGERIGLAGSQLSLIENGHREPKLSHLQAIAEQLGVTSADLLDPEPPSERSRMELDLQRLQEGASYKRLGLPTVRPTRSMGDDVLGALVGLHRELDRRAREAIATPEQARRDATALRHAMRERHNSLPELDELAEEQLRAVGYEGGSITHRTVTEIAAKLGFELVYVTDLPHSTRSVTDLENGRIYLPPASIPGGHGLRSMALQAIAHRLLGHHEPQDYKEFLQQRLEINYFAAATLMPRTRAVDYLRKAKRERNLAVEDFRDAFGVTHETAAMRFTNLATTHLDMRVHFLRVGEDGALSRVYENDGLPVPVDASGHAEGQLVCRKFAARTAFERTSRTTEFYQYTDTPNGTFWCSTQTGSGTEGEFSISFGVRFDDAKFFRGAQTAFREVSTCPDERCCIRPSDGLQERWRHRSWASARMHQHTLAPLPSGTYPGVDDGELYEFLQRHAPAL
ncbi:helix-turn-helix domain-containing protein [Agrococcus sp. HG114]|uniref:helix-turn-helix domain-containing protein n=1 Tax=Agrococcus sp. HG114 TaxID=2969757 RepID=UPI00215B6770|nr:XRE family transcriptional regulator [Agrococcus sp. HG114]MCR8671508.1 helix-turn-helix domain-containing protein [Agrococcus sp. HG114]